MDIVFNNQQNSISRLDVVAVILNHLDRILHGCNGRGWKFEARPVVRKAGCVDNLRGRTDIGLRQIQREGAAFARSASQLDFTAQEAGQFATDCEAKASAAILTAGAGVCLLESLKDNSLLVCRDADAAVRDLKRYNGGCSTKDWMARCPSTGDCRNGKTYTSLLCELECVRQEILEHLLQALGVRHQAAREVSIGIHLKGKLAILRLVPERTRHHFDQAAEEYFFGFDRDCTGLNL